MLPERRWARDEPGQGMTGRGESRDGAWKHREVGRAVGHVSGCSRCRPWWPLAVIALVLAGCGGSGLESAAAQDTTIPEETALPPVDAAGEIDERDTADVSGPGDDAEDVEGGDVQADGDDPGDAADPDGGPTEDGAGNTQDDAGGGPCGGAPDGTACEDGNACTALAECRGGRCVAVAALSCDDGNPCTDDRCDARLGCVRTPNLADCDDGDPCTRDDFCRAGLCIGGGGSCDDGNPCTRDRCAPDGACMNTPDDTLPCEDGSDCTGGDFCSAGVCVGGLLDGCAREDACRAATCADDGVSCDELDTDGFACDDGNACTDGDLCVGGACRSGGPLDCGWDAGCADFACDAVDGCRLDALRIPGTPCDDGDRCTEGTACDTAGRCIGGAPVVCDDNNPCTTNGCNPATGCAYVSRGGETCDDGNACTAGDTCFGSSCRGDAVGCDDGDPCTLDRCDPRTGCAHTPVVCDAPGPCLVGRCGAGGACVFDPVEGPCNDGRACTTGDACVMGACVGLNLCDDGDPCTTDICDAEEGCVQVPFEGACDDGDPCTRNEMCDDDGLCDGGDALPVIDDGLACTDDLCSDDPAGRHVPVPGRCGDGEACSLADGCVDARAHVSMRLVDLGPSGWFAVVEVSEGAALTLAGASVEMVDAGVSASIEGAQTVGPGATVVLAAPGAAAEDLEAAAGEAIDAILYLDTPLPALTAGEVVTLSSAGGREMGSATAQ